MERELGRLRGLLEKKYANPADSGYTYITNDGEKVALTPSMMSEWARAVVRLFFIVPSSLFSLLLKLCICTV